MVWPVQKLGIVTLHPDHRATGAVFRKHGYLANGWDPMQVWDGRSLVTIDAGIPGPSVAVDSWQPAPTTAAGNCTTGTHAFRYRYMDSKTGYVSNPSEERELTVASGAEQLTFSIAGTGSGNIIRSTHGLVDTIILEATAVGGGSFFEIARALNSASSVVASLSDTDLAQNLLLYPPLGHGLPPIRKYVVSHRGRLWLFGSVVHSTGTVAVTFNTKTVTLTGSTWNTDVLGASGSPPVAGKLYIQIGDDTTAYEIDFASSTTVLSLVENYGGSTTVAKTYRIFSRNNNCYVSRADYPESFPPLSFIAGPEGDLSGDLTAGVPFGDTMVFFTLQSSFRFVWSVEPSADGQRRPISLRGALSQRVCVRVEGDNTTGERIYALDREGFHFNNGMDSHHVSRAVDSLLDSFNWAFSDQFHGVLFPRRRAVRWYVCMDDDTVPKDYLELDLISGAWTRGRMDMGITESAYVLTSDGPRVYLGDENGHVWIADQGTCDGCPGANSHLTAAPNCTTTVLNVDEDMPTGNVGLAGCYVYHPVSGESRLISSNNATDLTVATAFTNAPSDGDELWVGRIRAKLKTRAFVAPRGGLRNKAQWRYVHVYFEPLSSDRKFLLRVYKNYSSTAKTWATQDFVPSGEDRILKPGKNTLLASSDFEADADFAQGLVRAGIGSDAYRAVEVEIEVNEPDTPLEVIGIELDGREAEPNV